MDNAVIQALHIFGITKNGEHVNSLLSGLYMCLLVGGCAMEETCLSVFVYFLGDLPTKQFI